MARKKKGVPKYYLYNYNQINEKPVDKFRLGIKNRHEGNATVKFIKKHNDLFQQQKEEENQGKKIPENLKIKSEINDDQVAEIVRDYSSYDYDRAE